MKKTNKLSKIIAWKAIGGFKIEKYSEDWENYQTGAMMGTRGLPFLTVATVISGVLAFVLNISWVWAITVLFLVGLVFAVGHYRGYNECLHEIESSEEN